MPRFKLQSSPRMKVMRRGKWGGPRVGAGAKPGTGALGEQVRSQKMVIALTKADLAKLKRLADNQEMPLATLAYQFILRALKRRK